LTYRSFFCGENLVAVASIVQKWARFDLKFFTRATKILTTPSWSLSCSDTNV